MNNLLMDVNQEARICQVLEEGHKWQVRFQATYWSARAVDASTVFHVDDRVRVVGRKNLVLLIQKLSV